jgi:ABC-type spermidine/putrescine transport system permease subunit I
MRVSAAIIDIPQVDVEAYQKQGFGRFPTFLTVASPFTMPTPISIIAPISGLKSVFVDERR